MIPNVLLAYAFDEKKLRAFTDMYNDLMLGESGLSKLEREMIAVAVSSVNHCYYCLTAHGAAVRQLSGDPALGEMMVMNFRAAELSPQAEGDAGFRGEADRGSRPRSRRADRAALARRRLLRSRHLGHRLDGRVLQHVEPRRGGGRYAAERGISRDGAVAADFRCR